MADETGGSESSQPRLSADGDHPSASAGAPVGETGNEVTLDQSEIEALLNQAESATTSTSPAREDAARSSTAVAPDPPPAASASPRAEAPSVPQRDIEYLLRQAEEAISSIDAPTSDLPPGLEPFQLRSFSGSPASSDVATVDLMSDVQLDLNIELGRTHMHLDEMLRLKKGSVVPLDKMAGDPVDIYANGRLIARGEVLVLNDNFCVRVAELVAGDGVES
ncbi:MAG: flagellar motor switch protein FliN [Pirellulales bacterium]